MFQRRHGWECSSQGWDGRSHQIYEMRGCRKTPIVMKVCEVKKEDDSLEPLWDSVTDSDLFRMVRTIERRVIIDISTHRLLFVYIVVTKIRLLDLNTKVIRFNFHVK